MLQTLSIFPSSGFDQSTTTPVLLGVLLSWVLTEWFGWVFAGLVVPGYLGAVFLLNPRSGAIDVGEAVITYGIARVLGEHLPKTGLTSRLFGRERFFLVVLVSILVRLAVEGWLLPKTAPHATWAFSIGLVVVPLAANACWKTGLARGFVQNGLPVVFVYLLLKYVFVRYTNLSLAGFELATENIGASFLASPKAYILLITGATLAASANLRYGWDFNGILIPALLALVVLEPVKYAATFVEVAVLLVATNLLIRATPLKRANIEGPRRTVLFFCVDYVLRYTFAIVVGRKLPGSDVVDLMGFGYLLPTLLAVKISQKGYAALVLLPAATVSVAAFVVGTGLGYAGFALDSRPTLVRAAVTRILPAPPSTPAGAALWATSLARDLPRTDAQTPPLDGKKVAALVEEALAAPEGSRPTSVLDAQNAGPDVLLFRERFGDVQDRVGDPMVLARTKPSAGSRVVLYIPTPLAAPETAAFAGLMLAAGSVDAVVIAGVEEHEDHDGTLTASRENAARTAARLFADHGGQAASGLVIAMIESGSPDATAAPTLVTHALAAAKQSDLASWTAHVKTDISASPPTDDGAHGPIDATLAMPASMMDARLAGPNEDLHPLSSAAAMSLVFGDLPAARYRSEPEDLLALRRLVLEPLLAPSDRDRSLARVRFAATTFGYRLIGPSPLADGQPGLALVPESSARPIALLARASGVRQLVVEVPQADIEGVRDLALRSASLLAADAVLFDLEHASRGGEGPVMRMAHAESTFDEPSRSAAVLLVRQARAEVDLGGVPALSFWGTGVSSTKEGGAAVPLQSPQSILARTKAALDRIGLGSTDAPVDLASRELAGRALLGTTPLVVELADGAALRTASLDRARSATKLLDRIGVQNYDGDIGDAAPVLARALPITLPPGPDDLAMLVRRTAIDESITAREALGDAIAKTATRALFVSASGADYLVAAARSAKGFDLAAASADPSHDLSAEAVPLTRPTLAECGKALAQAHGGSCHAEAP